MTDTDKPRITRCALCRFWMWSDFYHTWWCTRVNTDMGRHDGCTRGEEA